MRKHFLIALILFLSFTGFSQEKSSLEGSLPVRPNIVWIVCEDMSLHLSSFGEMAIQTPNLDALAKDGIKYTNAYTVAGVCAPSRVGIITAMYPSSIGGNNMRNYQAGPKDANKLMKSGLPSYSVMPPAYVKGFTEYLRKDTYYCTNNQKEDYQFEAPVTMWDESSTKASWKNRPEGKPFFAVFNLNVTHESQIWERDKQPLLVDPAKVKVPPYYPDVAEVRHDIARQLSNVIEMDKQAGVLIQQLKDAGLYDNTIIFFYSDHGDGLPYVKREVTKRGLWIPLIVKLPNQEKAGTTDNRLVSGIDFGPTVLSLANVTVPKYMAGKAFLGLQAEPNRKFIFAARDRMDEKVDRVRSVFDGKYQYLKNYMPELPYYQDLTYRLQLPSMTKILAMRDAGQLNAIQIRWFKSKSPEELYDTEKDPYQLNNLINDVKYKDKATELRNEIKNWQAEFGDINAIPEKDLVKKWWNGKDKAPITANLVLQKVTDGYIIECSTPGASIGYILKPNEVGSKIGNSWRVYNHEIIKLKAGETIKIKAQRIGYEASELEFTQK
jgi:N-sulfoglucosamine sulfohydrolase